MFIVMIYTIKAVNDLDSSDNLTDRTIVKKNSGQRYGGKSLLIVGSGSAILSGAVFGGLYVFTTNKQEKKWQN